MKSFYCKHLYNEINFDVEKIQICSGISAGASYELYNEKKYHSYDKFLIELLKWRRNLLKRAYMGQVPIECQNCLELQEIDISYLNYLKGIFFNKFPINVLYVKTYRQCELSCIYCLEKKYTHGKKTIEITKSDYYDFIPIFKKLINNKIIDKKNTSIEFHGGSISVWDEFEDVIQIAYDYGIKNFTYLTNAYRFIPKIAEIAQKTKTKMIVSLDCGCEETFKKIKQSDNFDETVNNIVEYLKANIDVILKYIIIKGVNDNIDELRKFCIILYKIIEKSGSKNIVIQIDIDYRDILSPNYSLPEEHKELIRFMLSWSKKSNIDVSLQTHVKKMYLK